MRTNKRMTLAKAVEVLEAYLTKFGKGMTPKVYTYKELDKQRGNLRPLAGAMVVEVSFVSSSGGCSFMQVDIPWGIAICGQAERVLLAYAEGWSQEELEEELWRLDLCFEEPKGKSK